MKLKERPCATPGCRLTLTELVPEKIIYCGLCQLDIKSTIPKLISTWFDGRTLPEEDIVFLHEHHKGCNAKELALHLKCDHKTTCYSIIRGYIKAKIRQRGKIRSYNIHLVEIVRILDLGKNWITISKAATELHLSKCIVLKYARAGYFGPITTDISGHPVILMSILPSLPKKYYSAIKLTSPKRVICSLDRQSL